MSTGSSFFCKRRRACPLALVVGDCCLRVLAVVVARQTARYVL